MKKYRLIKNYPGCGYNINQVIETKFIWDKHGQKVYLKNYPEFWEEVVEKDYEILSFISNQQISDIQKGTILTKNGQDFECKRRLFLLDISSTEERILKNNKWDIHSVKRLSDGEVFTVGDKVMCWNGNHIVEEIFIFKNKIRLYMKHQKENITSKAASYTLDNVQTYKQPLFTTEDNVDIFEGDKFYYITKNFEISSEVTPIKKECSKHSYNNLLKYCKLLNLKFSTKEAAEEHVLMNTPKLSIADVERELINGCNRNPSKTNGSKTLKLLKELVKSRL